MRKKIGLIGLIRLIGPMGLIGLIGLIGLSLTSCHREPLELYTQGTSGVEITFDWQKEYKETPKGMYLMFARDSDLITIFDSNSRTDKWTKDIPAGKYFFTVMSRTQQEYGASMQFFNKTSHNDLLAKSKTTYVADERQWDSGRTYLIPPERIGVATDTFYVKEAKDTTVFYRYYEDEDDYNGGLEMKAKRHEIIHPMTTTLYVHVRVRGINYMREGGLVGYITGMADGFWLNQRWRTTDVGTLKIENWERDYSYAQARRTEGEEEEEENVGYMLGTVETFGLPHGRELLSQRVPESNYILLHFTLLDGRTKDFSYLVGKEIHYSEDDGTLDNFSQTDVTLELNLEIDTPHFSNNEVPILPYAQPEGSGQFDAEVAPWGDDVDVDIPM